MSARMLLDALAGAGFRALVGLSIAFLLVPLLVAVFLSFDDREFLGAFPPRDFSLRWYRSFIDNPAYLDGLHNSLQVSLLATAISVISGASAALFLSRFQFRFRGAIETLFLSPKFVPTVVIGFSLLGFAASIGIYDPFTRLIMGHVIVTIPFTVRATLASLIGIRPSLVEAALSLGARPIRAYLDIVLPLARTGIVAGALMAFVLSFDEVAVSLFLADAFTQTLPIVLVAEMRANLNLTVAAVSTVFLALTLIVLIGLDRTLGLDRLVGQGIYRG